MALQKSVQDVVFSGGIDLKTDPNLALPTSLMRAVDVQYTRQGALSKRYGFSEGVVTATQNTSIFTTKEGNVGYTSEAASGRNLSATAGNPSLNPLDGATEALTFPQNQTALDPIENYSYAQIPGTTTYLMAWEYYAGGNSLNVSISYYGVWDSAQKIWTTLPTQIPTGGTFLDGTSVATITGFASPFVLPNGVIAGFREYTYANSFGQLIFGAQLAFITPGQNPATSEATTLLFEGTPSATDYYGSRAVFSCTNGNFGTTGGVAVAVCPAGFPSAPYTPVLCIVQSNATYTILGPVSASMCQNAGHRVVAICADQIANPSGSYLYMTDGQYFQYTAQDGTSTSGSLTTPLTGSSLILTSDTGPGGAAPTMTAYMMPATGTWTYTTFTATTPSTAPVTVQGVTGTGNCFFQSVPFTNPVTYEYFAWVCVNNSVTGLPQSTYVCVNLATGTIVGRAAYLAGPSNAVASPLYVVGSPLGGSESALASMFLTFGAALVNFGSGAVQTAPGTPVSLPQFTYLSYEWGGAMAIEMPTGTMVAGLAPVYLTNTDGQELGFSYFPQITASQLTVASGGNVTGTVQYAALYQWVDSFNQVHWSNYSPVSITCTNSKVTLPALPPAPNKGNIFWFRTTNAGTIFYQLTGVYGSATVIDDVSDANLTANGNFYIYTTGGELENDPPPSCSVIVATSSRAFALSAENPNLLYYSKPFRDGHPPEWCAELFMDISGNAGPGTALAVMDDQLIIFKKSAIYLLTGAGPDVTGNNNSFALQPVTTFSGALNQKGVVVTDQGVFFQSSRGISMIDRSLTEQFVGKPLGSQVQTIVTSTLVKPLSQVRFCDSGAACTWVYDTISKAWTTFSIWGDSATSGETFMSLLYSGSVVQETPGVYYDFGTTFIAPVVTTAWLKTSGLQGFARLYRLGILGNIQSSFTQFNVPATVGIAYDYVSTVIDTLTLGFVPGHLPPPYTAPSSMHWRSRVPRQQMAAVQFTFTWPTDNESTEDFYLTGISLEIGVKPGIEKLPAGQSV